MIYGPSRKRFAEEDGKESVMKTLRVLATLAAMLALLTVAACGESSAGGGGAPEEQGEGAPNEATTPETTASVRPEEKQPRAIGEVVKGPGYELRVLNVYTTERYYRAEDAYLEEYADEFSTVGKFVVVDYSITNMAPNAIAPQIEGILATTSESGREELFEQVVGLAMPYRDDPSYPLDDIQPRGVIVSQLSFDVPTDAKPEALALSDSEAHSSAAASASASASAGVTLPDVDLTVEKQQATPQEVFSLQMLKFNERRYEDAYALFAEESQARVPFETFQAVNEQQDNKEPVAVTELSFPNVDMSGEHATMKVVRTLSIWKPEYAGGEDQAQLTQEAVRQSEGWRILMRPDQYQFYGVG